MPTHSVNRRITPNIESALMTESDTTLPWSTLGEIKEAHRQLLEASDDDSGSIAEQVRAFIKRAVGAGRFIDIALERAEAQRLINYWLANLPASNRSDRISIKET